MTSQSETSWWANGAFQNESPGFAGKRFISPLFIRFSYSRPNFRAFNQRKKHKIPLKPLAVILISEMNYTHQDVIFFTNTGYFTLPFFKKLGKKKTSGKGY